MSSAPRSAELGRTLVWRDRTIAWDVLGAGPPLVLLHGTPWSSALWRPIAETLAERFSVYLWDMPGYGASSKHPDHAVDLGVQGELFAALLSEWGLTRPHVIAHDIGGAVALRARLLHGVRFASLALVDVVALAPWGSPYFTLVREHADVFARLPGSIHRASVEAYVGGASLRGLGEADLEMLVRPWLGEEGQPAFYRQIAQADERHTDGIEGRYAELDEPTLVVWGAEDTWIPPDRAHRLHDLIPGSRLVLLEAAGHLVQLDAPAALTATLTRWADSHDRTP